MKPDRLFVRALARCFLAGEPEPAQIVARSARMMGREWRWLQPLARRYIKNFNGQTLPRERDVVQFFLRDAPFRRAWTKHSHELTVEQWLTDPQRMRPVAAAREWNVPAIESPMALAKWLDVDADRLRWFADLKGIAHEQDRPHLSHYHYRVLTKQFGSIRLIEVPKPRLKEMQRKILWEILERIPPHPAVHGFCKGRSIRTFVAPHIGKDVVLRMDLRDFFPTFRAARIQAFFRTLGYPEAVADLLGGICTNATPSEAWKNIGIDVDLGRLGEALRLYARPHLPQGTPTSPALANLCSYRIDSRLNGLAQSVGAVYTRYADDLAFSGDSQFARRIERFSTHLAAILMEEGFSVHHRKTRVMRQSVRQHLAGLVLNQHANVVRADFDRLKATLTNCARFGPASQNREEHTHFCAHLQGKVSFVEMVNPEKAKRLRAIFEQISW